MRKEVHIMELQDVLNERRSIRNYDADKKVTKEQLEIILVVRDSVKKHIVETGSDKKYGARPLRRAVQSQLEDKLAEALLNGEIKRGDHVEAGISKKEIKFTVREINS
jgi:ATP-dependent Clp protease ATP-binding subunit ClpC